MNIYEKICCTSFVVFLMTWMGGRAAVGAPEWVWRIIYAILSITTIIFCSAIIFEIWS